MQSRRDFLRWSSTGMGALLLSDFLEAEEESDDGYKALVVIYQAGGNDGLNMFIPSGSDAKSGYAKYAAIRDTLKVKDQALTLTVSEGKLDLSEGNPYQSNSALEEAYTKGFYQHEGMALSTNALMPEIAHLVNSGKVAMVVNTGNLSMPSTKEELQQKTKARPPFLFAHNHQTKLTMNGEASKLDFTGWAGRLYDHWMEVNAGDIYGFNISIGRSEHLFYGDKTIPLLIGKNGPTAYYRLNKEMYENTMALTKKDRYRNLYNSKRKHSFSMQDTIVDDWKNQSPVWEGSNAYGNAFFTYPTDTQLNQKTVKADKDVLKSLKAVAKLAYIGKNRGLKRQIFFIYDGGYDTHSNQTQQHARKLRGLSLGIGDFCLALEEMGMERDVTTFTVSDFGRSTGNNGDGTDHAWGGTYFAVGGAVNGGVYGTMPDLTLGGEDDLTKKGRLIPTTSMSQYYGTILKWFGVDESLMSVILPELKNFKVKDLAFMTSLKS